MTLLPVNRIIKDDCLDVMKDIPDCSIDLIYADPPFFSGKTHADKKAEFNDKWDTLEDYTEFMKPRFVECNRILKESGTMYLHCDWHASHYLKIEMDSIFGYNQFRNEIIWWYHRWTAGNSHFQRMHDTIFRYTKSDEFCFNMQYKPYGKWIEKDYGKTGEGGVKWRHSGGKGKRGRKVYYDPKTSKGVSLDDVWEINRVGSTAKERVGYPTQKPEYLLERIINASSNEGDIILDPFCGSGTTCSVAKRLFRNYIGIDLLEESYKISRQRTAQEKLI